MLLLAALLLAFPALGLTVGQQAAPAPASVRVWEGRTSEYEEFLRTATIVKTSTIELGVTHPKRVYFAPGGLASSAAWKPLKPGYQNGYFESYKSEIAAYELDKLLKLGMIPVIVERKIDNTSGALVLWLDGVRTWTEVLPLPKPDSWSRQLARMKLFDDLIGNPDRNKGNLLVDAEWNLFLIDHSRAFIEDRSLPQALDHVDTDLWTRMTALDEASVQAAAGTWLTSKQIKAMLARRDKMAGVIDGLVKKNGRRTVFAW